MPVQNYSGKVLLSFSSVQFSRSVVSDSLWPHEPQHTRPPCSSPTPGVQPNPCPLSWWCHPTISSSVIPFSSCPQSFPASLVKLKKDFDIPSRKFFALSYCSWGRNINNLRYAGDTTLMAESEEELKCLMMSGKEESEKAGLKLNLQKTKIRASSLHGKQVGKKQKC